MRLVLLLYLLASVAGKEREDENEYSGQGDEIESYLEVIVDGKKLESDESHYANENGTISITGRNRLEFYRSTGLDEDSLAYLTELADKAVGNKYRLVESLREGGRVLSLATERFLLSYLSNATHKASVWLDGDLINFSQSTVPLGLREAAVTANSVTKLIPVRHPEAVIELTPRGVIVQHPSAEIRVDLTRGISRDQAIYLRDRFDSIVSQKSSAVTGLPLPIVEFLTSGRNRIIDRLVEMTSPERSVEIDDYSVPLNNVQSEKSHQASENNPSPVTINEEGWLSVKLLKSGKIKSVFSSGLSRSLVTKLVDSLHRAITLRVALVSWSNQLIGSVPPELESAMTEILRSIQKRKILINGEEVDLMKASVLSAGPSWTKYYVQSEKPGEHHTVTVYDEEVALEGIVKSFEVSISPGLGLGQMRRVLDWIRSILQTATVPRSVSAALSSPASLEMIRKRPDILELLEDPIIRGNIINSLVENVWQSEYVTEMNSTSILLPLNWSSSTSIKTLSKETFVFPSDFVLTKYKNKDNLLVVGRSNSSGRFDVYRSTGLNITTLTTLSSAITELNNANRFRSHKGKDKAIQNLEREIEHLRRQVHTKEIKLFGEIFDFNKAAIITSDEFLTVYQSSIPHYPHVQVWYWMDGRISLVSPQDYKLKMEVKISKGISQGDFDTILNNLHKLLANNEILFKKQKNEYSPNKENSKYIGTLVKNISPIWNISVNGNTKNSNFWTQEHLDKSGESLLNDILLTEDARLAFTKDLNYVLMTSNMTQVNFTVSWGLSHETIEKLWMKLHMIAESQKDLIDLVVGSKSNRQIKTLGNFIRSTMRQLVVTIDNDDVISANLSFPDGRKVYSLPGVDITSETNGLISINSLKPSARLISVTVNKGITPDQSASLADNVISLTRTRLSKILGIKPRVFEAMAALKEVLISGIFTYMAPSKETILVDTQDRAPARSIRGGNLVVTVQAGHSSAGGVLRVERSTGVPKNQASAIVHYLLDAVSSNYRPFVTNMDYFTGKITDINKILTELMVKEALEVNGEILDEVISLVSDRTKDKTVFRWSSHPDITLTKLTAGGTLVEYGANCTVILSVSQGITGEQAQYINRTVLNIRRRGGTKMKFLSSLPKLIVELFNVKGKLRKDLRAAKEILETILPYEEFELNGKRFNADDIHHLPRGLTIRRDDGSIKISFSKPRETTANGPEVSHRTIVLESSVSSGLSINLLSERLAALASDKITPFVAAIRDIINGNFSILSKAILTSLTSSDSLYLDPWIKDLDASRSWIEVIAFSMARQLEKVVLDDKDVFPPTDTNILEGLQVSNQFGPFHVNISGRNFEKLDVILGGGLPSQDVVRLIKSSNSLLDLFTAKKGSSLSSLLSGLYKKIGTWLAHTLSNGITQMEFLLVDGKPLNHSMLIIVESGIDQVLYRVDGMDGVTIRKNDDGTIAVKIDGGQHNELSVFASTGFTYNLAYHFIDTIHNTLLSRLVSKEDIFHMIKEVRETTRVEDELVSRLEQEVTVEIDNQLIAEPGPGGPNGSKLLISTDGKICVTIGSAKSVQVRVGPGLPPGQVHSLKSNVHAALQSTSPVQIFFSLLDLIPVKTIKMIAQLDSYLPFIKYL